MEAIEGLAEVAGFAVDGAPDRLTFLVLLTLWPGVLLPLGPGA